MFPAPNRIGAIILLAETDNVISINIDEAVEALDLKNIDGAYGMADLEPNIP